MLSIIFAVAEIMDWKKIVVALLMGISLMCLGLSRTTEVYLKIYSTNRSVAKALLQSLDLYIPPWWYSPIIGTLVPFGRDRNLNYEREILRTGNSASFAIDWFPQKPRQSSPLEPLKIIVFLPGLALSSRNKFCQQFVEHMHTTNGYVTVVLNARGLETELTSSEVWHPGLYEDCLLLLEHIQKTVGNPEVYLVGYSAGTAIVQNVLLHLSRQQRTKKMQFGVKAGFCVCVCHEYTSAREYLESSYTGKILSFLMTQMHHVQLRRNLHVLDEESKNKVSKALQIKYLSEYDKYVATELHGFDSEEGYIAKISVKSLDQVSVPLLLLQPADDPLLQNQFHRFVDVETCVKNPMVTIVETSHGNHFGFYEGHLHQAFTNESSYTYPAMIANTFFGLVSENIWKHS